LVQATQASQASKHTHFVTGKATYNVMVGCRAGGEGGSSEGLLDYRNKVD